MVKVTGGGISQFARGKFGKTLLYQGQRSIHILRRLFKPKNPKSTKQKNARRCVYCAHLVYASMYEIDKNTLNKYVQDTHEAITSINFLVKICQKDEIDRLDKIFA